MKMTRRNFLSTSAVAALACGASLTAHAAGSTDENSLNFITDIFKDPTQPGEVEGATRACGGIPSSMPKPVCLKYVTASIRCVALIWPMRPSSAPTTAGSFLMS